MKEPTLSVVVSAFNEEKKIATCLNSVKWAHEIIFVDNSSTDKTVEIARKYTTKIIKQENNPMSIDLQKNVGFSKATGDWILSIDADESVSKELQQEIVDAINKTNEEINGYWIPRKNIIFGKWIKYAGWYPDYQMRLFVRGKGKYTAKHVHEMIQVDGALGHISSPLDHRNYESCEPEGHTAYPP